MKGTKCRMARAAVGWSLDDLAAAAGVNKRMIMRPEANEPVQATNSAKMREVLEREGVVFIERGVYLGGVVPPMEGR
jgi:DNA-binding XRE family transcriptional regulator